jgi:uncharacterized DUF497 family protein
MEFEWTHYEAKQISTDEIVESFEDPFSLRLLPDANRFAAHHRFISLGRSNGGKGIFAVYTSTGKVIKIVAARPMTDEENYFYERKIREYE